jgi:uncharacterized membrane protein YfcA
VTLWLFAVAAIASAFGGMLGMAGGIFIVPILTMFGGIPIHLAVAASLVSVIACSCGGAAPFLRRGWTNLRLAIVLEVATTLGALSGVCLAGWVPLRALLLLFAAVLLVSAWQMFVRRPDVGGDAAPREPSSSIDAAAEDSAWASALQLHASYPDQLGRQIAYRVRRVPLGLALMYGAGLLSALLGIGSGVLKIPAMDSALRLPIKVSSATSSFMIGVTAAASAGAYFLRGDVVPAIAGPVALGSVLGAVVGARLLLVVRGDRLRQIFVVVLVALALEMTASALGVHGFGGAG